MKIFKLTILSLAVFVLAAITYSCSKQDQAEPVSSTTEISQSDADILMENKIRAFKSKMEFLRENPSYKSGESMSVDSAVWYMEAASNYTYSHASNTYNELVVDSININVPTHNGQIQLNDMLTAYDEMINDISESYYAIPNEEKYLVVNDVSFIAEESGIVTLGIIAGFGIDEISGTNGLFGHEWWFGHELGDCDFNNPGTDAAEQIEDKILLRKGTPSGDIRYSNVETFSIQADGYLNTEDLIPYDNMYDYLMFYMWDPYNGTMPNVHYCVSVEEMNFYLLAAEYILSHDQPQFVRPPGKTLITIDMRGDGFYPLEGTLAMHYAIVTYGIPFICIDPPDNL